MRTSRRFLSSLGLGVSVALFVLSLLSAPAAADPCSVLAPAPLAGDWTSGGVRLDAASDLQIESRAIPDGSGGAIVVWRNQELRSDRLFAARFDADGRRAPGWAEGGNPVGLGSAEIPRYLLCPDEGGGCFVGWLEGSEAAHVLSVQHVLRDGTTAPGWPDSGVRVSTPDPPDAFTMVEDDSGGVFFGWQSDHAGSWRVRVWRMAHDGTGAPGWPSGGVAISDSVADFDYYITANDLAPDGMGGVYATHIYSYMVCWMNCWFTHGEVLRHIRNGEILWSRQLEVSNGIPDFLQSFVRSDGSGGVIHARGQLETELEHVNGQGDVLWSVDLPGPLEDLAADQAGNSAVSWSARAYSSCQPVYGAVLASDGQVDPAWAAAGYVIATAPGERGGTRAVPDGAGGAYFFWTDDRENPGFPYTRFKLYAEHVGADARVAGGWEPNGNPLSGYAAVNPPPSVCGDGRGGAFATWVGDAGYVQHVGSGQVVSTLVSLGDSQAGPGWARLTWLVSGEIASATIWRAEVGEAWRALERVRPDGTGRVVYEDHDVIPGHRVGYRLGVIESSREFSSGEVWLDIPREAQLSLEAPRPNPGTGRIVVHFSLASGAAARLDLIDVAGRTRETRDVGALGAGAHVQVLGDALAPGVYFVRLTQDGRARTARACIVR